MNSAGGQSLPFNHTLSFSIFTFRIVICASIGWGCIICASTGCVASSCLYWLVLYTAVTTSRYLKALRAKISPTGYDLARDLTSASRITLYLHVTPQTPEFPSPTTYMSFVIPLLCTCLVLRIFIRKPLSRWCKLSQFASHHLVRHLKLHIFLSIVDLELQSHKLGKNRATAGVGSNRRAGFHGICKRQRNHVRALPC